ncbi:hypothetical protein QBC45DRAFT_201785 [Copromyces sp. CBS 386.78]|nr:hypothetical protein QBC45DRAFT_201785 [Copromyces sp. CBS 386.78]
MVYVLSLTKRFLRAAIRSLRIALAILSFAFSAMTFDFNEPEEDSTSRQVAETVFQAFINMDSETFHTHDPDSDFVVYLGHYLLVFVT